MRQRRRRIQEGARGRGSWSEEKWMHKGMRKEESGKERGTMREQGQDGVRKEQEGREEEDEVPAGNRMRRALQSNVLATDEQ